MNEDSASKTVASRSYREVVFAEVEQFGFPAGLPGRFERALDGNACVTRVAKTADDTDHVWS